jgi:hypothetical protein
MYALQVAVRKCNPGTLADYELRGAMQFLDNVLGGMPPETARAWGVLCRKNEKQLMAEARNLVDDEEDRRSVDNHVDDPPF